MNLKYFLYGNGGGCLKYMPHAKKPRFLKYDLSIGDCYGFDPHNLATYHQLMSHYGSMKLYYYDQYIMNDELVIQVVVI